MHCENKYESSGAVFVICTDGYPWRLSSATDDFRDTFRSAKEKLSLFSFCVDQQSLCFLILSSRLHLGQLGVEGLEHCSLLRSFSERHEVSIELFAFLAEWQEFSFEVVSLAEMEKLSVEVVSFAEWHKFSTKVDFASAFPFAEVQKISVEISFFFISACRGMASVELLSLCDRCDAEN